MSIPCGWFGVSPGPTNASPGAYDSKRDEKTRYEPRLNDFVKFCRDEYNVDPLHAKLLASALIPCSHTPIWLIVESSNAPFWADLSYCMEKLGWSRIWNLARLRTERPRNANRAVDRWMQDRHEKPQIFIDTHFENPDCWQGLLRRHGYWRIAAQCIRARIHVPLSDFPDERAKLLMLTYLRNVIDFKFRQVFPKPFKPSPVLLEFIKLLPRLNPELSEPMALLENLTLLAASHAAIHGRTELTDDDWWAMCRCLKGSVRYWTRRILTAFYHHSGMLRLADLVMHTGSTKEAVVREVGRLEGEGILRKRKCRGVWHYEPTGESGLNAVSMISGNVKWW